MFFSALKKLNVSISLQVEVRVWARRSAINQVDFALDQGITILEYFEQFFDEKFPLPKQGAQQSTQVVFDLFLDQKINTCRCSDICV